MSTWRAGCGESRTSGSEGGPRKRAGGNAGTAPRSDPYTEHPTHEGKVYCAVVLDTYSRRIVGWSIDSSPTAALVTNALGMAIDGRRPTGPTVIDSDQGTQYGSWAFTRRALDAGLLPSMGAIGTCYDSVDGVVLEPCAGRAAGPAGLVHAPGAGHRALRVPGNLP